MTMEARLRKMGEEATARRTQFAGEQGARELKQQEVIGSLQQKLAQDAKSAEERIFKFLQTFTNPDKAELSSMEALLGVNNLIKLQQAVNKINNALRKAFFELKEWIRFTLPNLMLKGLNAAVTGIKNFWDNKIKPALNSFTSSIKGLPAKAKIKYDSAVKFLEKQFEKLYGAIKRGVDNALERAKGRTAVKEAIRDIKKKGDHVVEEDGRFVVKEEECKTAVIAKLRVFNVELAGVLSSSEGQSASNPVAIAVMKEVDRRIRSSVLTISQKIHNGIVDIKESKGYQAMATAVAATMKAIESAVKSIVEAIAWCGKKLGKIPGALQALGKTIQTKLTTLKGEIGLNLQELGHRATERVAGVLADVAKNIGAVATGMRASNIRPGAEPVTPPSLR